MSWNWEKSCSFALTSLYSCLPVCYRPGLTERVKVNYFWVDYGKLKVKFSVCSLICRILNLKCFSKFQTCSCVANVLFRIPLLGSWRTCQMWAWWEALDLCQRALHRDCGTRSLLFFFHFLATRWAILFLHLLQSPSAALHSSKSNKINPRRTKSSKSDMDCVRHL